MSKTNAPVARILIDLDEYLQLLTLKETVKNQEEEITKHYKNSKVNESTTTTTTDAKKQFGQRNQGLILSTFTYSFYARRSQKRKKILMTSLSFYAFGFSTSAKSCT